MIADVYVAVRHLLPHVPTRADGGWDVLHVGNDFIRADYHQRTNCDEAVTDVCVLARWSFQDGLRLADIIVNDPTPGCFFMDEQRHPTGELNALLEGIIVAQLVKQLYI